MIVKTAIGFLNRNSDDDLVGRVQGVLTGLTGNPAFATPAPPLADVTTALTGFTTALADAVNRDRELVAAKNAKRAELVSLMRQLASYVTITSDGDMTKLLSSGFPHQKPVRQRVGTLPAPLSPRLRQGEHTGELLGSTRPIYGASGYNWIFHNASSPPFHWYLEMTPRLTIPGGFEIATRSSINVVAPEAAADEFRSFFEE